MNEYPRLKDLGRWLSGGTPPSDDEALWDGDVPWISAKDIDSTRLREPTAFISAEAAQRHSRVVRAGAILIIVRGMALAHGLPVVLTEREVAFNQDLRALVPGPSIHPRFLHYSFIGYRHRLGAHVDRAAHGTARVIDSIYGERVWLPACEHQEAIAGFLDGECERIDLLQDRLAEIPRMYEELGQADLDQLLYGNLGPEGDHWFGSVPKDYEIRPLGSLGRRGVHSFFDGDWIEAPFLVHEGIRLLQTGNVGRGSFIDASERYISEATFHALRCSEVRTGDVLFSRLNLPMARACLAPELPTRMIASVDVAILRPSAEVEASWLVALASSSRWLGWLGQLARGTTMLRIARTTLSALRVPIPPIGRQREIAAHFDRLSARHENMGHTTSKTSSGLDEYRDALITEAVTGQLDVSRVSDAQMNERAHAAMEGEPLEAVR